MSSGEPDRALIERLALLHEGNARMRGRQPDANVPGDERRSRWSQDEMIAASSLAMAASYWSMIDAARASELYVRAAQFYRSIGHAYWIALALASGRMRQSPLLHMESSVASPTDPQGIAFAHVANAMLAGARSPRPPDATQLDAAKALHGNPPVGRLGVPLDYYGDCAAAMHTRPGQDLAPPPALGRYLRRVSEVLRGASHDRWHWLGLHSAVLPAEPEAVAVVVATIQSGAMQPVAELDLAGYDEHATRLINIGIRMSFAADVARISQSPGGARRPLQRPGDEFRGNAQP